MRIRKTCNIDLVKGLLKEIFPSDEIDVLKSDQLWIVWNDEKSPVGFCSLRPLEDGIAYLNWAGLLDEAKGQGLHKRMIKARESWAKKNKYKQIITYTTVNNIQSARNLLKTKYELFLPEYAWAGENYLYFQKDIQ